MLFLWGANARENHPIFFHHVLKAVHRGARLYAVDPRRTTSAQWADRWLGLHVGSDIALANAMARVIIHAGLAHEQFIEHATSGFDEYRQCVETYTLDRAEQLTGVPAAAIEEAALAYARADRAIICWTLGITEHHNAVDNVLALINLALLTGHVGRYGSGVNPLRGQNNVQGGGDMGAIPNRLVGFQEIRDAQIRARFEKAWGVPLQPDYGYTITQMFEAMDSGELTGLYVIGENPAQSEADPAPHPAPARRARSPGGPGHLPHQDCRDGGRRAARGRELVRSGRNRHQQRAPRAAQVQAALTPPGDARDELWILAQIAKRMGQEWGEPTAQAVWEEVRTLAPAMFGGMSYARLESLGGIQWPCPDESHPGSLFLHDRLWAEPLGGPAAPFSVVEHDPPVEAPDAEYPYVLTTGRRLDSYNTGVQTMGYASPLRRPEALDLSPEDAAGLGLSEGIW